MNISHSTTILSGFRTSEDFRLFDGLHCGNIHFSNEINPFNEESSIQSNSTSSNAVISDVGRVEVQSDSIILGSLSADMVPTSSGFPVENDEYDLDMPTEGFSSITEAIEDIRRGKMVVVVDDEDRENEGDLIMAASKVTAEAIESFVKYGTGIVCVSMKEGDLERLQLHLMVTDKANDEKLSTAFTISVKLFLLLRNTIDMSHPIRSSWNTHALGFNVQCCDLKA